MAVCKHSPYALLVLRCPVLKKIASGSSSKGSKKRIRLVFMCASALNSCLYTILFSNFILIDVNDKVRFVSIFKGFYSKFGHSLKGQSTLFRAAGNSIQMIQFCDLISMHYLC